MRKWTWTEAQELLGRRVLLRPLCAEDWEAWSEIRHRCRDWLLAWEPLVPPGHPDPAYDRRSFTSRCAARERERQVGAGFGFGIFVGRRLVGEINLNALQRGAFQNAYVGYWVDQSEAGHAYVPEATVVLLRFAFEELDLHRVQISVIPRNLRSRRVVEKVGLRDEGVALRYIEINGVWEDHVRYAITAEEWSERRADYLARWILPAPAIAPDRRGPGDARPPRP